MPVSVTMPRLGESVSEGTVTRWLKQEGDRVEADEPLLEVSTDKVDTEIPAPSSGVLTAIKVGEDETVDVGVELAVISEGADASAPAPAAPAAPAAEAPAPTSEPEPAAATAEAAEPVTSYATPTPEQEAPASAQAAPAAPPAPPAPAPSAPTPSAPPAAPAAAPSSDDGDAGGPYVTPLVRRLAAEHDVDLSALRGTGVGGRIRKQDVLDAARAGGIEQPEPAESAPVASAPETSSAPTPSLPQPAPVAASAPQAPVKASQPAAAAALTQVRGRTEKLSRLRSVIATRMVESLQLSAQLTTVVEVDITRIARLREQAKGSFEAREGVKLTYLPFFAVAACEALKLHPKLNASIDQAAGTVTYHDAEHLGIAVDTERGLLAPVIHGAGDLNLGGMARKIADLAGRTRNNAVTPDELGGGTFTLTNTGSRGALFDTPILFQPQVGILGTGTVVKRPAVIDDPELGEVVAVRSMVYLALTYDHRLVDGADAARFLTTIKERLEEGAFEADLGF